MPAVIVIVRELELREPNSSTLLVHEVNGTLFHRSWTRHVMTGSVERSNSLA